MRNAFHQATVAEKHIGAMVDNRVSGPVEFGGKQFFGERHADGVGDALTERTRCGFHARRNAVFRMARCF